MAEKSYLTKSKHEELGRELEFLKLEKRREMAKKIEEAKGFGDLSENAEYHAAREEQANMEHRIAELEILLKTAEVVEPHHTECVEVGAVVKVKKEGSDQMKIYQIVGSEESDMAKGKLSNEAPLGIALMQRKKGDTFAFKSPAGTVKYTVVDIE